MSQDDLSTTHALRLLCQEARKQATRWASDVATNGMALASKSPRQLTLSLVCGCLLAVFGITLLLNDDSRRSRTLGAVPAYSVNWPDATQSQAAPSTGTSAAQAVRWEGQELVIVLEQVPLAQAIAHLAAATGAAVSGSHLLRAPVRVTLHLRTKDPNGAWQQLLHRVATFSLSCGASSCQVWISGEISERTAPAERRLEGAPLESEREQRPGVTREEMESQPDGSC